MSNKRRRNEDLEAEDNKRPRNQDDLDEEDTDEDDDDDEDTEYTDDDDDEDTDDDDDDEQLEDGPFLKNRNYFSSECLPDQSDIEDDDDDDDDCGFIGDLVGQQPFNEDDDQEEHNAFERRIEARRSPIMCSGQKEVGIDEENRDSGGDNKGNWALADILVTVHKPGEDSSVGVVRHVLPDGSFKIALGSNGNGEVIIAVRSEIEIVAPRVSDKVKIMGGAQHGATGKLIDTEEGDAIVKVDGDTLYNKDLVLDMNILAKLA